MTLRADIVIMYTLIKILLTYLSSLGGKTLSMGQYLEATPPVIYPQLQTMRHYSWGQANYLLHVPNANKLPLLLSSSSPPLGPAYPPQERSMV